MPADTSGGRPARAPRAAVPSACLLACLLLPLAYAPETFVYPHVSAKSFVLFAAVPAAVAAWACLLLVRAAPMPRQPGPVTWSAAAFVASAAVSTAFGADPRLGLWDSGARMVGLLALGAFGTWAVLALACARDDARWLVHVRTSLVAGGLVCGGAVLQGLHVLDLPGDGRATSTLGHATFVGSLGLHLVFLGAALPAAGGTRGDAWLGRAAALLGVGAITASVTRASGVGLVAGAAVFLAWRFAPRLRTRRALIGVAVLAAFLAATAVVVRTTTISDAVPLLRRLAGTSASDPTVETRLLAWDAALDAARDRPLLGWGLNAYPWALDAHFPPRLLSHGAAETWFDDAHGVLFNVVAEQGLVGLAAYAAIYAAAVVALRRAQASGRVTRTCAAALAAWLAARFAHLAFSFEDLSSLMGLTLVLAWIEHLGAPLPPPAPAPATDRPVLRLGLACAATAVAGAVFAHVCVRPARDYARVRSALATLERFPRASAAAMTRIATSGSGYTRTSVALWAWTLADRMAELHRRGLSDEADEAARHGFVLLGGVLERHPRDVQAALLRARLTEVSPALRTEAAALDAVRRDLSAAREFAPRRQQVAFALAELEMRAGRPDAAADALRRAVETDPAWAGTWARLAMVYRTSGRVDEARRIVRQARERGVVFGAAEQRFVGGLRE